MNTSYREIEVKIPSEFALGGTLTVPKEEGEQRRMPAVLIIPGTGKSNRDGNKGGLNMNIYKDLALYIASLGYVTLRYDKRGTHHSEGDYYESGMWDLVADAEACVEFLKNRPEVHPQSIFILGHSEGALLAPAVHNSTPVRGLILLSGGAEATKPLLARQTELALKEIAALRGFQGFLTRMLKVTKKVEKQQAAFFNKLAATDRHWFRIKGIKVNAKWFRETLVYNVVEELRQVDCPVLAVTGEYDIQVPPEQAKAIAELVKGEAEYHIIPRMNHILKKYEKPHSLLKVKKEYKQCLNRPIDPELLRIIAAWLHSYGDLND